MSNYFQMGQLEFLEKAMLVKIKDRMLPKQIWSQLEEIFADRVMLREAMEELRTLHASNKLGGNFMAKLANTLIDTRARLDKNGNGDYLRHPREIAHIQNMLPRAEKLEYIKREKR